MFKLLKLALDKKLVGLLVLNIVLVIVTAASDVAAPMILSKIQGAMEGFDLISGYNELQSAGI